MKNIARHVIQVLCLFLTLYVFVLSVHSEEDTDGAVFGVELGHTFINTTIAHLTAHKKTERILPDHQHGKKYHSGKHISVNIAISKAAWAFPFMAIAFVAFLSAITERYKYLFSREINPPPPKFVFC